MTSRTAARRAAIDALYQVDLTGAEAAAVLSEWELAGRDVPAFARELVTGVAEHLGAIDALLSRYAEGWSVSRMPAVDRSILRIAVYELRFSQDVPRAAAIDEAVRAAKTLSTESSGRFVNGVLGRIARDSEASERG